jgi:TonB-dependent receptor
MFIRCSSLLTVMLITAGTSAGVARVADAQPSARVAATGAIAGKVLDAATGAPLIGADVALDGTAFTTATDRTGDFRLSDIPPGSYSLLVLYLGHTEQRTDIVITAGRTIPVDVKLSPSGFSETVQVKAEPIGEGQARALNQQRTAANITNVVSSDQIGSFPDPNAAEAASRIPGVSIARDQGEGRYVLVRGTEARLNSMMIDGERIPSPEGDVRNVQLDAVPADQLQSIEVSKAVTPDMDADSIGGAVNLVTKQAVSKPTMLLSAAGGYNALQKDGGQRTTSGTFGRRFSDGRIGFLVGGSASHLNRGSENFEVDYSDGNLDELQTRDYIITRERFGINTSVDYRANANSSFIVRGIFNKFRDYEINNRPEYQVGDSRIERVLKNRHQNDTIGSLSGTGNHVLGPRGVTLDYRLSWARAEEHQPDRLDTVFRQSKVTFAPNVSAASIDPDNIQANPLNEDIGKYTLKEQQYEPFLTRDREWTGSANLRMPLASSGNLTSFLKAGVKFKDKRKFRDDDLFVAEPSSTIPFSQFQDQGFSAGDGRPFLGGRYPFGPGISPSLARAYFDSLPASAKVLDHESDAADYDATERVAAGYAMAEIYAGSKLLILPGFRYESTKVNYTGYDVQFDEDGEYDSTTPLKGGDRYGFFLPGLHVRYSLDPQTNIRAAYTRTLARPNYYDLVPYELVFREDQELERGNSALKPTTSNNLDFLVEHYFQSVGVLSGGLFYKRLKDYIYPFVVFQTIDGERFQVTQPQNGDAASLWGTEIAFQNQLKFLPGALGGLGVYANYTWTRSSAKFPGREGEDARLPGQSSQLGNFSLWYERYGFSAKASWNFHGKYVDSVGETAAGDIYYDNHTQLDMNLSQRISRNIRVYADFLNLTNAPLRYYIGTADRPIQEEYYRWWSMFGVKAHF